MILGYLFLTLLSFIQAECSPHHSSTVLSILVLWNQQNSMLQGNILYYIILVYYVQCYGLMDQAHSTDTGLHSYVSI